MMELATNVLSRFAACASQSTFLGLPTWYKYLPSEDVSGKCTPKIDLYGNPEQVAAIALALVELLLIVGGVVAVGFVIYGGFRYLTSQGEPENTKAGQQSIINALVGLVIVIMAVTIVRFVGARIGG